MKLYTREYLRDMSKDIFKRLFADFIMYNEASCSYDVFSIAGNNNIFCQFSLDRSMYDSAVNLMELLKVILKDDIYTHINNIDPNDECVLKVKYIECMDEFSVRLTFANEFSTRVVFGNTEELIRKDTLEHLIVSVHEMISISKDKAKENYNGSIKQI